MMGTIKAKDAKFGRWYQDNDYGIVRCVSEVDIDKIAGFVCKSGDFRYFFDAREIEHLPECDSFDWQPAAEGNPNGVRWFASKYKQSGYVWARCSGGEVYYFNFANQESGDSTGKIEGNFNLKEITTAEALTLIGANGWPEGVAKAKELAGIVEEVEHAITEGSVWQVDGEEYTVKEEDGKWIAENCDECSIRYPQDSINMVFGSGDRRTKATWLRDAEPAQSSEPASEEVRWYLDEAIGIVHGFASHTGMWINLCDGELFSSSDDEEDCIDDNDTRLTTAEVLCRLARANHTDAWHEARKLARMSEHEAYAAGQSVCGIAVGDRVRVTRKAAGFEMGWRLNWHELMTAGEQHKVININLYGIRMDTGERGEFAVLEYPYHVLSKVEVEQPAQPEIDPGEGWRLIDKDTDTPMEGDEIWGEVSLEWRLRICSDEPFCNGKLYRRRIEPVAEAPAFAVGDWVRLQSGKVEQIRSINGDFAGLKWGGTVLMRLITKATFRPFANRDEYLPFAAELYHPNKDDLSIMLRPARIHEDFLDGHSWGHRFERSCFADGRPFGIAVEVTR